MAVPAVSKAIPSENPPESSAPAQDTSSPEESNIQTTTDQPNGVDATQEMAKQTEEIRSVETAVLQQEVTADPAGATADLPVPEEAVPSAETPTASTEGPKAGEEAAPTTEAKSEEAVGTAAETPVASSEEPQVGEEASSTTEAQSGEPAVAIAVVSSEGPQAGEEVAPTTEAQSQEPVVAPEESPNQEVKPTSVESKATGDELKEVAEKNDDPNPSPPKDVIVNSEDGKSNDSLKPAVEDSTSLCLEAVQDDVLPNSAIVDVATQNEIPEKEEPVPLISKAIQSKGTSKSEAPLLSTHHLSGWFVLCKKLYMVVIKW